LDPIELKLVPIVFGHDGFGTRWLWNLMDLDPIDLDPIGLGPDGFGTRLLWTRLNWTR